MTPYLNYVLTDETIPCHQSFLDFSYVPTGPPPPKQTESRPTGPSVELTQQEAGFLGSDVPVWPCSCVADGQHEIGGAFEAWQNAQGRCSATLLLLWACQPSRLNRPTGLRLANRQRTVLRLVYRGQQRGNRVACPEPASISALLGSNRPSRLSVLSSYGFRQQSHA
ncbi:hypothetical protein VTK56DRAFT_5794 [Thermocarpiscus australiensis]